MGLWTKKSGDEDMKVWRSEGTLKHGDKGHGVEREGRSRSGLITAWPYYLFFVLFNSCLVIYLFNYINDQADFRTVGPRRAGNRFIER